MLHHSHFLCLLTGTFVFTLLHTFHSFQYLKVVYKIYTEPQINYWPAFKYYTQNSFFLLHVVSLNKDQYWDSKLGNLICRIIAYLIFTLKRYLQFSWLTILTKFPVPTWICFSFKLKDFSMQYIPIFLNLEFLVLRSTHIINLSSPCKN